MEVCSAALRPTRMVPLTARPISASLQVRPAQIERCDQRVVHWQRPGFNKEKAPQLSFKVSSPIIIAEYG